MLDFAMHLVDLLGHSPGAAAPATEMNPQNECGKRAKRTC